MIYSNSATRYNQLMLLSLLIKTDSKEKWKNSKKSTAEETNRFQERWQKDSEKQNHLLCLWTNHCNLRQGQQKNLVEMEEVIGDVVVEENLVDNKVDRILLPSNIFALTKIFPTNFRMLKLTSGNFLSLSDVLYRAGLKLVFESDKVMISISSIK